MLVKVLCYSTNELECNYCKTISVLVKSLLGISILTDFRPVENGLSCSGSLVVRTSVCFESILGHCMNLNLRIFLTGYWQI